jgi:AcrR family transcriptional regulator
MYPTREPTKAIKAWVLDRPEPPKRRRKAVRRVAPPTQHRAQATKAMLLLGTRQCLAVRGFAGTSTAAVAKMANVAEATIFRHFEGKNELLAATVEATLAHLTNEFERQIHLQVPKTSPIGRRVSVAVHALWHAFRSHEMRAIFEVYVAARTDGALGELLAPILAKHREGIMKQARALLPEAGGHTDFEPMIDTIVYAMQGTVIGMFGPDLKEDVTHIKFFERLARREVEHVTGKPLR